VDLSDFSGRNPPMAACASTQAIDPRPIAFKRKGEAGDQAPAAELDFPDEGSGAQEGAIPILSALHQLP
jgi:hypothetical protein